MIKAYFYQKPKICKNPKHKISFADANDKYNPFGEVNYYAFCSFENIKLVDFIAKDLINIDLKAEYPLNIFSMNFNDFLRDVLKQLFSLNNIEFKRTSKYWLQQFFLKLKFFLNSSCIELFVECNGASYDNEMSLISAYVMQMHVDGICVSTRGYLTK